MTHRPADASSASDPSSSEWADQTRGLIDGFFAALTDAHPARTGLDARLRERHAHLLDTQRRRVVDEPSRYHLALTLAVVAAYEELSPGTTDEELLPLLEKAFVEPLRPEMLAGVGAALDASPDPFATMVGYSRQREQGYFGSTFTFSHPRDDDEVHVAQVEHCFYHEVLEANGVARLTPVLCAFDANWIDAIDPERHAFAFERPTTIGHGGPHCPFRFLRTTSGGGR
ncbi:L-2-amino-thiazoline-4-carboxylic acid hydrolase [Streptomyces sp. I05A-00742]|uniref:L-2-amino-thiazoline-4-carboxylic acid hydrolase n=1 Tax=Streptomyces sp. I05A-00742 TaxID=2732853 RepID=UPI0014880A8E|nr:L-2-amino-thiazoline-4-carboxylic acid hydrolase [Streptomyces sp. I05A-00742]